MLEEELEDGHAAQLRRCRTNYRGENSDALSIFEYGWVLTRGSAEEERETVRDGIRILKALQFQEPSLCGYIYIAIARAHYRLGEYQKARQHAQILIQTFPKSDGRSPRQNGDCLFWPPILRKRHRSYQDLRPCPSCQALKLLRPIAPTTKADWKRHQMNYPCCFRWSSGTPPLDSRQLGVSFGSNRCSTACSILS